MTKSLQKFVLHLNIKEIVVKYLSILKLQTNSNILLINYIYILSLLGHPQPALAGIQNIHENQFFFSI